MAIDRLRGESFEVDRANQLIYRLNLRSLANALMRLLGGRVDYLLHETGSILIRLGRLPGRFSAAPLHLCLCDSFSLQQSLASYFTTKLGVVLVPSLDGAATDLDLLEEHYGCVIFAADELFMEANGEVILNQAAIDELTVRLGIGDDSQVNTFRLAGDQRLIRFEGKQIALSESVGLWYLSQFLTQPDKVLNPVDLEAARTGIVARSSNSSTGAILDEQARREYSRRLADLDEEIAQAQANNDLGTLEQLQTEKHEIANEVSRATGLQGKSRVSTDESKARKNVRQAMSRDINRIAKSHPTLAEHLTLAFKGDWMSYRPSEETFWEI